MYENKFSIEEDEILNLLGILPIQQNVLEKTLKIYIATISDKMLWEFLKESLKFPLSPYTMLL